MCKTRSKGDADETRITWIKMDKGMSTTLSYSGSNLKLHCSSATDVSYKEAWLIEGGESGIMHSGIMRIDRLENLPHLYFNGR